jgi:uncharacterized repeat protein (TIGR03803 family)
MRWFNSVKMACIVIAFCAVAAIGSLGQTYTVLDSFDLTNGISPYGTLAQGVNGGLYGAAANGGTYGNGVLFEVAPGGALTKLHNFSSGEGKNPNGGVVLATDGHYYGTASFGGANDAGSVFRVTPSGVVTLLYSFCSQTNCADGSEPLSPLVQASNGNFFGTTYEGGAHGDGTVFEFSSGGTFTLVHSFCSMPNCADGEVPQYGLVQASNGSLYGTTPYGGANGHGSIFAISPAGAFSTIYSFCAQTNCTDGSTPYDGLIQGPNGYLYGTAAAGGANGDGTVFKITGAGTLTTLYSFCSQTNCTDGANPESPLMLASDGNFYGMTFLGGANAVGSIFRITPSGSLSTLYSFCSQTGCTDGEYPSSDGLVQATDGTLFGTTVEGGTNKYGVVFSLGLGLGAFVEPVPIAGKVGSKVTVLGNGLTGTTSVTFNGLAATFTVVSDTEITANVPTGTTTGKIVVVTPGGDLKSNVAFRVVN